MSTEREPIPDRLFIIKLGRNSLIGIYGDAVQSDITPQLPADRRLFWDRIQRRIVARRFVPVRPAADFSYLKDLPF